MAWGVEGGDEGVGEEGWWLGRAVGGGVDSWVM